MPRLRRFARLAGLPGSPAGGREGPLALGAAGGAPPSRQAPPPPAWWHGVEQGEGSHRGAQEQSGERGGSPTPLLGAVPLTPDVSTASGSPDPEPFGKSVGPVLRPGWDTVLP